MSPTPTTASGERGRGGSRGPAAGEQAKASASRLWGEVLWAGSPCCMPAGAVL